VEMKMDKIDVRRHGENLRREGGSAKNQLADLGGIDLRAELRRRESQ
jgi:hypothetical protein